MIPYGYEKMCHVSSEIRAVLTLTSFTANCASTAVFAVAYTLTATRRTLRDNHCQVLSLDDMLADKWLNTVAVYHVLLRMSKRIAGECYGNSSLKSNRS